MFPKVENDCKIKTKILKKKRIFIWKFNIIVIPLILSLNNFLIYTQSK